MAAKPDSRVVDEFMATIAATGSRCFDLNSHDGLTPQQQTAFFNLGRSFTLLMQQLTDRFNALVTFAGTSRGAQLIANAEAACETAIGSCDVVKNAPAIPSAEQILAANSNAAHALDLSDDVLAACG